MTAIAKKDESTIYIEPVRTEGINLVLIGLSPLICNRMSEKVKGDLLMPRGRITAADKQSRLKHNPLAEYRNSPYVLPQGGDTLLGFMASAIKGAMMTAALDLPGAKKAQIGRLVYVVGDYVPIYGIPKLFMSVTRSADMNRTPDVRTRAIIPQWAALVTIKYVTPLLNAFTIVNLLSAGGITAGIGDWRPEKGKGSYGQFSVANPDDPDFAMIKQHGRIAQQAALDEPETYDEDTAKLLAWYMNELKMRGREQK